MNQDPKKRNATKHYQNSDYPSGSFEAAIKADHETRLREAPGLRLERHPSIDSQVSDLEEMVPAHMHRDFFRSEEDAVQAVAPEPPRLRSRRSSPAIPPQGGYTEPPRTEDDDFDDALEETLGVAQALAGKPARPPAEPTVEERPAVAEPLAPLRSGETPAGQESPPLPPPQPQAVPAHEAPREHGGPASPAFPARQNSPYSLPMLVALAVVMAIFVWREQTRPVVAVEPSLPLPQTVQTPVAQGSSSPLPEEPRTAAPGFRPTFMAVGPPVPVEEVEAGASPASESPENGESSASLFPGAEGEAGAPVDAPDDPEAADRAAILERMSQMESSSPPESESLFPEAPDNPEPRPAAPVRTKEAPAAPPAVKSPAPVAKPVAAKPDPVAATSADLFPIDEELPIKQPTRPTATAAAAAPPPPPPAAAPRQSIDGYQIDEPNL